MLPQLSIHADCKWQGGENYHVRAVLPLTVSKALAEEFTKASSGYFYGIVNVAGLRLEVHDAEHDGEIAWAFGFMDDVSYALKGTQEGLVVDLSVPKPNDEDVDGVLPDLFWIEPSRIIRRLLSLTRH